VHGRLGPARGFVLVACGGLACHRSGTPPEPPSNASERPQSPSDAAGSIPRGLTREALYGSWVLGQMPVSLTYNSRGRVRVRTGAGACVGFYRVEGDVIVTEYEHGQTGCVDARDRVRLDPDGNTLRFPAAYYVRVDRIDDRTY